MTSATFATFSDVRKNFKHYCDKVRDDASPVVITRARGENVVLISEEEWNSIEETLYIMSQPDMVEGLRQSAEDIKAGRVTEYESMEEFRQAMMARV